MTFEVGETYPTRGGGTATVFGKLDGPRPFRVQHDDGSEIWHYPDGAANGYVESPRDLIAPAVEPEAPAPAAKTLRDEFAMAALPCAVADYGEPSATGSSGQRRDRGNTVLPYATKGTGSREEIIARQAYRYADAMLAARAQGGAA
ncbi:MAG: hypothetical protein CMK96_06250 [Pseudomonas sp.]|nr:hypothetical protein [Pseudomonas sp.]QDP67217.1 MAG: hypothetical protein GOVbin7368_8 [Prokaryotic dsDNA virus sp.]|tara:strand:- start:34601 stop:35038 length:438 start_codon:yes stop_codon:yes gene_type:complete